MITARSLEVGVIDTVLRGALKAVGTAFNISSIVSDNTHTLNYLISLKLFSVALF